MKKIVRQIIMLFLLLSSCSQSNLDTTHISFMVESNVIGNSLSDNQKYVPAKRIYDVQYDVDGYDQDEFIIDEFPNFVFRKNNDKMSFSIDGKKEFGNLNSIYVADFNNDGYLDLGYSQSRSSGSSNISCLVRIYDYHSDQFIFDDDNHKNSFLDIDEEGNAIIEELAKTAKISGLSELNRAGRFLKGDTINFEWYSFDFKLKGMWLEASSYKNGKVSANVNQKTNIMLRLCGIGSESLETAIALDQIQIKRDDEHYSFEVSNSAIASLFNITFIFFQTGTMEIEVSIEKITTRLTIYVISE